MWGSARVQIPLGPLGDTYPPTRTVRLEDGESRAWEHAHHGAHPPDTFYYRATVAYLTGTEPRDSSPCGTRQIMDDPPQNYSLPAAVDAFLVGGVPLRHRPGPVAVPSNGTKRAATMGNPHLLTEPLTESAR